MPPFLSTSKALCSLASRKSGGSQLIRSSKSSGKHDGCRCITTAITGGHHNQPSVSRIGFSSLIGGSCNSNNHYYNYNVVQSRRFLGCGDGEEGILSRTYEERRVLGYSTEQLFEVVSAVDFYHGFVPWCQRSDILRHYPDGSFDAELEIGFKFLVESYVSHVELDKPKRIKFPAATCPFCWGMQDRFLHSSSHAFIPLPCMTTVSQSTLFEHLINIWEFNPGPVPGSCDLYFLVDFKFQSPLYRQIASVFFKEVASRMVGSFTERCRLIYGPEVRVLENSYGKRA
ncbi:Coenzyme Q-binding protein COQ10 B, mitochondrial [Glycine soja]